MGCWYFNHLCVLRLGLALPFLEILMGNGTHPLEGKEQLVCLFVIEVFQTLIALNSLYCKFIKQ